MNQPTQRSDWVEAADPLNSECPSRELLDLVGDRWSLLVMLVVGEGVCRNGVLKRRIGGISQKMLTQTLRTLEANGLVTRTDFATVPPHVEYSLTALGLSLRSSVAPLFHWVEAHYGDVVRARLRHAGASLAEGGRQPPPADARVERPSGGNAAPLR